MVKRSLVVKFLISVGKISSEFLPDLIRHIVFHLNKKSMKLCLKFPPPFPIHSNQVNAAISQISLEERLSNILFKSFESKNMATSGVPGFHSGTGSVSKQRFCSALSEEKTLEVIVCTLKKFCQKFLGLTIMQGLASGYP